MSTPTVVKVVAPARLDPLEDRVRRIVELSDGSERMEWWDFLGRAWVTCPYDVGTYALGFNLSEADRRTLGIPLDDLEALRVAVPDVMGASAMPVFLIIVARDRPELLAQMQRVYADASEVEVRGDRRQGQPWPGPDARPDRRARRSRDTELRDRGFIVARPSGSP